MVSGETLDSAVPLPGDLWPTTAKNLRAMISDQFSVVENKKTNLLHRGFFPFRLHSALLVAGTVGRLVGGHQESPV